jgi:hypothetical protein
MSTPASDNSKVVSGPEDRTIKVRAQSIGRVVNTLEDGAQSIRRRKNSRWKKIFRKL